MEIFLDHAATTPVRDEVVQAMLPYLQEEYGNPSSLYEIGIRNRRMINLARQEIQTLLGLPSASLYFTSGGTEANNWALKGLAFKHPHKKEIITTRIEHHSILNTCLFLERLGFTIRYVEVDQEGFVHPEALEGLITDQTLMVSLHYANNEIGTIQDIPGIARVCQERKVYFHVDATQAVGHVSLHVQGIDLLSFSAHKFYGPKGIGALYVREGIPIEPLIHGGGQEKGLRAGTENVAAIAGLVTALRLAIRELDEEARLATLSQRLYEGLKQALGDGVRLNGPSFGPKRLANNVNVSFKGIDGNELAYYLGKEGIYVSTGSACDSDRIEPSHVLQAIRVPDKYIHGTLRMTLGRETTEAMVDQAIHAIVRLVKRCQ